MQEYRKRKKLGFAIKGIILGGALFISNCCGPGAERIYGRYESLHYLDTNGVPGYDILLTETHILKDVELGYLEDIVIQVKMEKLDKDATQYEIMKKLNIRTKMKRMKRPFETPDNRIRFGDKPEILY
jgi:hypothetical protein